jgi:hypothetical protein
LDEHDDDEDEDDDDDDDDIIMVPVKVEEDLEDNNDGMLKASIDAASTPKHVVDVEIITRIVNRANIMARDAVVVVIVIIDLLNISIVLFLFIIIIIWLDHYLQGRLLCYSNSNSNTTLSSEGGRGLSLENRGR